jgi:hypothetical protein
MEFEDIEFNRCWPEEANVLWNSEFVERAERELKSRYPTADDFEIERAIDKARSITAERIVIGYDIRNIQGYCFTTATHVLCDWFRRAGSESVSSRDAAPRFTYDRAWLQAVDRLKEARDRRMLITRGVYEIPYETINRSEAFFWNNEVEESTARSRYSRAQSRLLNLIASDNDRAENRRIIDSYMILTEGDDCETWRISHLTKKHGRNFEADDIAASRLILPGFFLEMSTVLMLAAAREILAENSPEESFLFIARTFEEFETKIEFVNCRGTQRSWDETRRRVLREFENACNEGEFKADRASMKTRMDRIYDALHHDFRGLAFTFRQKRPALQRALRSADHDRKWVDYIRRTLSVA